MVEAGQHVAECIERRALQIDRQRRRLPSRARFALGAGAVALRRQHARDREPAHPARRCLADEAAHDGGVAPLLPQPRLGAPAQSRNARPIGIGVDEGGVARESGRAPRMAQQRPFDQRLRHRIADRSRQHGRFARPALAHQRDRLLRGGEIGRQRRHRRIERRSRSRHRHGSRSRGAALFALPRRCAPFRLRGVRVTLRLGGLARERRHRPVADDPGGPGESRRHRPMAGSPRGFAQFRRHALVAGGCGGLARIAPPPACRAAWRTRRRRQARPWPRRAARPGHPA